MPNVTQEATYRGQLIDWGVSKSSGGYPQFVAECFANEMWDEKEQEWVDVSECQSSIVAYLVLVDGKRQPTFHHKNLMEALGWDGKSYAQLSEGSWEDVILQFRVEENTFDNKTTMQVRAVDVKDAVPGVKIRRLEKKELGTLDSEFADLLKAASGSKPTVASAGKKAPAKSTFDKPNGNTMVEEAEIEAAASKPKGRGRPKTKKGAATPKPTPPARPAPPVEEAPPTGPGPCDMGTAWDKYCVAATKLNESRMNEIWLEVVEEVAQGIEETDITDEQWGSILAKLLAHKDVFPF